MRDLAARGDGDELARFRRLLTLTIAATLVLILIGGIVRVSDSGLGCGPEGSGTHGWPLCEGGVLPADSAESTIEFSHRVAAAVVGVLIVFAVWLAFRRLRVHRWIVRGSVGAGLLVLAQAGLGGLTVEQGLEEELVAAHLGLAMLLLGLLIALRRAADPQAVALRPESMGGLGVATVVAAVLVLATIVAGGYVAGTEREGTPGEPVVGQAHVACGTGYSADTFPACNEQFPGFGQSRLADIQLVHRTLMYLAALAVLAMAAIALVRRAPSRAFGAAALLLVAQIGLGILNVWAGKHAGLILGHLALGTVLWSTVVYAGATLLPASEPAGERVRRRSVRGAVTA
ncbi:MAG: protoheme farnesyltransferase (Heme synthase) (HemeB farnesyltransferase) [Solirubrobacterales bacterium]|jgi:heme A synthase|nr:protoheme farnesyltransferase (Heme synthase) (HemeB farnesyltransferase) [Solirubrobacterales bacterium]